MCEGCDERDRRIAELETVQASISERVAWVESVCELMPSVTSSRLDRIEELAHSLVEAAAELAR